MPLQEWQNRRSGGRDGKKSGKRDGKNLGSLVRISFAWPTGDWIGKRVGWSGWRHENKTSYQSTVDKVSPGAIVLLPDIPSPLGGVYLLGIIRWRIKCSTGVSHNHTYVEIITNTTNVLLLLVFTVIISIILPIKIMSWKVFLPGQRKFFITSSKKNLGNNFELQFFIVSSLCTQKRVEIKEMWKPCNMD